MRTTAFLVEAPSKDFGNLEHSYIVENGRTTRRAMVLPTHLHIPWLIHDSNSYLSSKKVVPVLRFLNYGDRFATEGATCVDNEKGRGCRCCQEA